MSGFPSLPTFTKTSLGLNNEWLDNTVDNFGSLLIEHKNDDLKNGQFKLSSAPNTGGDTPAFTGSGFTVYSAYTDVTEPNAAQVTDGTLKTGDKIYYYDHTADPVTHTLIGTVDAEKDGYFDDLKINFEAGVTNENVLTLGQALQYGAGSLGGRSLSISVYDTNGTKLDATAVPASANPIVIPSATDGFNFDLIRQSFTENSSTPIAITTANTSIAHATKDALNDGAGNYKGTTLEIAAMSDFSDYVNSLGSATDVEFMSPEFVALLAKVFGMTLSDAQTQTLDIDATDKSFTYDKAGKQLKVGDDVLAEISFGEFGTNPIVTFKSDLATTALVNEVLQSITYLNTQDAIASVAGITWNLKEQNGVDNEGSPTFIYLIENQTQLINLVSINDAPLLKPTFKSISFTEKLDFAEQDNESTAIQTGVYSSENTQVYSTKNATEEDAVLALLSNQAATMVSS